MFPFELLSSEASSANLLRVTLARCDFQLLPRTHQQFSTQERTAKREQGSYWLPVASPNEFAEPRSRTGRPSAQSTSTACSTMRMHASPGWRLVHSTRRAGLTSRYSRAAVRHLIAFGSVSSASSSRTRPLVRSGIICPSFVTRRPVAPEYQ